jgi:hypothetical protein
VRIDSAVDHMSFLYIRWRSERIGDLLTTTRSRLERDRETTQNTESIEIHFFLSAFVGTNDKQKYRLKLIWELVIKGPCRLKRRSNIQGR